MEPTKTGKRIRALLLSSSGINENASEYRWRHSEDFGSRGIEPRKLKARQTQTVKDLNRRKEAILLDHASMRYQALQLSFCSNKYLSGPDINLGGQRRIIPLVNLFMRPLSTDYLVWLRKYFTGLELRCSCSRHACNNSNNQLNLDQNKCWGNYIREFWFVRNRKYLSNMQVIDRIILVCDKLRPEIIKWT